MNAKGNKLKASISIHFLMFSSLGISLRCGILIQPYLSQNRYPVYSLRKEPLISYTHKLLSYWEFPALGGTTLPLIHIDFY